MVRSICIVLVLAAGVRWESSGSLAQALAAEDPPAPNAEDLKHASGLSRAFQFAARTVRPAVVNISVDLKPEPLAKAGLPQDLFHDFFNKEPDGKSGPGDSPNARPKRKRKKEVPESPPLPEPGPGEEEGGDSAQGTGVLVSKDGYILTNNHVVERAERITVRLSSGKEYPAKIIGVDKKTDLAVIQIHPQDGAVVPCAEMGDSDLVEVGEWVLAVGSPFGLEETVTAGIVSAKSRSNVGVTDYEDFIQTDAAINPGNSGGPMVNLQGKVIGINTAIATRTGSNMGIGFSIPVNQARFIMSSLIKDGRVQRGKLGVMIQELTFDLAKSFGYAGEGVLVGGVERGTPAEKSGMRAGDIIQAFNGKLTRTVAGLRNLVAAAKPGSEGELDLYRDGKKLAIKLSIAELDPKPEVVAEPAPPPVPHELGVEVIALNSKLVKFLSLENSNGALVTSVQPNSPGERAGLIRGDVIVEVENEAIENPAALTAAIKKMDFAKGFRLRVQSKGYVFVKAGGG